MLIITDEELIEGLIGGFGWILAVYYLRNQFYKKKMKGVNLALIGAVSWCFLWYIRKTGINLYREYKKIRGNTEKKKIEVKSIDNKLFFILLLFLTFLFIFYLLVIQFCGKSSHLMKITKLEIPFILFILFSVGLIYYSE